MTRTKDLGFNSSKTLAVGKVPLLVADAEVVMNEICSVLIIKNAFINDL